MPLDPDAPEAALDLAGIDRALAAGARTVLLTQPQNPLGRVYRRAELEGLRDVVTAHGARVVSDEIHAPLVLPGAEHVPYLSLPGTAGHAVSVVAASKAFNTAGLRCAQIVTADEATRDRLVGVPEVRNDSWSPLGVVAAVAAYTEGDAWLAALVARLDAAAHPARRAAGDASCRRRGCGRWRRRTWPGSTCGPTATTTPRRSIREHGGGRARPRGTTTSPG